MKHFKLARLAVKLWSNPLVPKRINRYNQRAWIRSVEFLGEKWLIAKQQPRLDRLDD